MNIDSKRPTIEQADYIPAIVDRARERRETYQYEVVRRLPSSSEIEEVAILGSYSVILLESKVRYLLSSKVIRLEDHLPESPATVARDYLKLKYKQSPRVSSEQIRQVSYGLKVNPHYAAPRAFKDGYYIDIRSTYLTILDNVGWNLDYWPGRYLSRGTPPDDFPWRDNKAARNCLVSLCIGNTVPIYFPPNRMREEEEFVTKNTLQNLQLWRCIQDVLFCVAYEVRRAGAIYIQMDGYIAPDYKTLENVIDVLNGWKLPFSIKYSGRGQVSGFCGYSFVGQKQNKSQGESAASSNLVSIPYLEWLKAAYTS